PLPVHYDIIYGGSYAAAAATLADWKRRKGYQVRTWNASGWTAQRIRDTIMSQSPRATYLLVISDPDGTDPLPPSAIVNEYYTTFQTDALYGVADTTGYLPSIFCGRLSVKTASEANAAVDKLVRYELAEFGSVGTAWLSRALLIAGYDPGWQWLGIATNAYCRDIMAARGYDVDTLIMAPGEWKGRIVPLVNAGTAWTVFSAHGSVTGWGLGGASGPYWNADQLDADLSNQDMFTMPMGHCCNSGDFYSGGKAPGDNDCFGETWPRLAGKGGVSYFGSVPSSYWDEDDWLQRRYFDAIYDSVPGTPGLRLAEAGRFTQYGLFWIEANAATALKRYYFEAYHLLNDPAMDFWTGPPAALAVAHPAALPRSGTSIAVTVRDQATAAPLADALVCAWSRARPQSRAAAYSDAAGAVALPFGFTSGGDTVLITATRHGYRPHLGYALMGMPVAAAIAPAAVDINVPTAVTLALTDPDSGNAPVADVRVYLDEDGGDSALLATTDAAGQAGFTVTARSGAALRLRGHRTGQTDPVFEAAIAVRSPATSALDRAAPNPFRSATRIGFALAADGDAAIAIYDVLGRRVRTLLSGRRPAGYHSVVWDGRNADGTAVAAGIYFCRLATPRWGGCQRLVLVR
ncbi:hypothetical protein EG831_02305, partial [bacterium]|nr:hypothetical protein [bacterium]